MVKHGSKGQCLMSESEGDGDALARLELALDRIARRAHLICDPSPADPATGEAAAIPVEMIADRLDGLIGQIRGALENGAPAIED